MIALVMTGAGGLTVIPSVANTVPPALVALIATEEIPVATGVPEMTPVPALMERPVGRPVAL